MKIEDIETYSVSIPLVKDYKVSFGTITHARSVIVKIVTDTGHVGYGEADPLINFLEESVEGVPVLVKKHLLPVLVGCEVFDRELIHTRMNRAVKGNRFAKGSIDTALYDLAGKELGIPVHDLVGGCLRDRFPVMWPLGANDPEETARDAADAVREKYGTLMIKGGTDSVKTEIERVKAVREEVGPDVKLIVDANCGWTTSSAVRIMRGIEELDIAFVEQPLPKWDTDGMARIRSQTAIPLSADEGLSSIYDAGVLGARDAVDIFSIKLAKHGGLTSAKKIAAYGECTGRKCFVNSMIEMGISVTASKHFLASTPNIVDVGHALMSTKRLKDDILKTPVRIKNGFTELPKGPGLGIEIDEGKIEEYSVGN